MPAARPPVAVLAVHAADAADLRMVNNNNDNTNNNTNNDSFIIYIYIYTYIDIPTLEGGL